MTLTTRPKVASHNKKRAGLHHKQSKHYGKPYWPYLPMLLIALTGVLLNQIWKPHTAVLGATSDITSSALLAETNSVRTGEHERGLALNESLQQAASAKAKDMVSQNYWSHTTPDGKQPWTFVAGAGYTYNKVGENLAYGFGSAHDTVSSWMNSQEHRANILDDAYSHVGFGVATSPNYLGKGPATIIVAYYAEPATATVPSATMQNFSSQSRSVARIQVLTGGQATWSFVLMTPLLMLAVSLFAFRHVRMWHKVVVHGEHFVLTHPYLDVTIVTFATVAFLLTRVVGAVL